MIEPIRGADFQARGLLLALQGRRAVADRPGPRHGGRASVFLRNRRPARRHFVARRRRRSPDGSIHRTSSGMIAMVRGAGSLLRGQWKPAQAALDQAEQLFRNRCTGVTWERDTVHNFVLWALIQLGEVAELKRRWTVLYRESQERGDLYAATTLTTFYMTMIKLSKNERVESERELEAFVDRRDEGRFNLQHSSAFESLIHLYLYRGDVSNAWARLGAIWPAYSRSMLLRIRMIRIDMHELRGRTALAMAEKAVDPATFLRQAKDDARRWNEKGSHGRSPMPITSRPASPPARETRSARSASSPWRWQITTGPRCHCGPRSSGSAWARSRATTRRAVHRDKAEAWIREQGIVSPARWAGMYAPGFLKISTESIETSY